MARPDPIEYAERLYGAIRSANFSPISFLAFGNAIKDGVSMRNMPRIAAEPFMRVVGEMLDLEEESANEEIFEAAVTSASPTSIAESAAASTVMAADPQPIERPSTTDSSEASGISTTASPEKRRGRRTGADS